MSHKSRLDLIGADVDTPASRAGAAARADNSWFVQQNARALWRKLSAECRDVAPAAWRAGVATLSAGGVLTLILTVVMVVLGQRLQARGLQDWDVRALRWVAAHGPLSFANAITWQAPGDLLFQPIFVLAFVAIAAWLGRPLIAVSMATAYAVAFAFIWAGWGLWNRPRPDLVAGGLAAPGLHSFPSGHAVLTVAIYGLVAYLWARASRHWLERAAAIALCVVLTALVGLARLALGAHWPSDVLGGAVIGLAWLVTVILALRRAERVAQQ
jgi:membrane-associated phospholipid phosphatase